MNEIFSSMEGILMKLYLDPGHGGSDPGAEGNGLKEKDIVLDIAHRIRKIILLDYANVEVKMSRTSDTYKTLDQRTNEANSWGADFYLSIHCNASNGKAQGYEDYMDIRLSDSSRTAHYQDMMHAEILKKSKLKDRGQKKADFYVLRETRMDALLTENGFIDHIHDATLMKDSSWLHFVAQGHVNGLKRIFSLESKTKDAKTVDIQIDLDKESKSETIYKVIAGSFQLKENAVERVRFLRIKQMESFIEEIFLSDQLWYRVQVGAFLNRENAEKSVAEIGKEGIKDVFIISELLKA